MNEHPFFRDLREAIQNLDNMNETYNPNFQTEARPGWTTHPNPQQRRINNVFYNVPAVDVEPSTVDVNHQVVQELPSAPINNSSVVHVLIAHYEHGSGTPPDVVGVYSTKEKAKAMFDLLEKYRDEAITFYLVEKEVE